MPWASNALILAIPVAFLAAGSWAATGPDNLTNVAYRSEQEKRASHGAALLAKGLNQTARLPDRAPAAPNPVAALDDGLQPGSEALAQK